MKLSPRVRRAVGSGAWMVAHDTIRAHQEGRSSAWNNASQANAVQVLATELGMNRTDVLPFVEDILDRVDRDPSEGCGFRF